MSKTKAVYIIIRGTVILIDAEDCEGVLAKRWRIIRESNHQMIQTSMHLNGERRRVNLPRFIMSYWSLPPFVGNTHPPLMEANARSQGAEDQFTS